MRFPIDCLRRRLRRLPAVGRIGFRRRSRVAALAASSRTCTSGSRSRWPWRSMDSTRWGSAAFNRFPRFDHAVDPVGGFPDHDHRCSDGLIVAAPASHGMRCAFIVVKFPKQPDAMLAMVTGHRGELVEDPALVLLGRRPVTVSYCCQQLLFCHLADALYVGWRCGRPSDARVANTVVEPGRRATFLT